jgi:hypothetical protein
MTTDSDQEGHDCLKGLGSRRGAMPAVHAGMSGDRSHTRRKQRLAPRGIPSTFTTPASAGVGR